jgi:hypothetical protein
MSGPPPPLSREESWELNKLEECIRTNEQGFLKVGLALSEIKSKRLYRATHKSFSLYCAERLGYSRIHAYRLINAAKVVELLPIGYTISNETQARELGGMKPQEMVEVLEKLKASSQPITAETIRKASRRPKPPRPTWKDNIHDLNKGDEFDRILFQFCLKAKTVAMAAVRADDQPLDLDCLLRMRSVPGNEHKSDFQLRLNNLDNAYWMVREMLTASHQQRVQLKAAP